MYQVIVPPVPKDGLRDYHEERFRQLFTKIDGVAFTNIQGNKLNIYLWKDIDLSLKIIKNTNPELDISTVKGLRKLPVSLNFSKPNKAKAKS